MSRDSNIGDKTEYDVRTVYIPLKLVEEEDLEALQRQLTILYPGGAHMTRTEVGELYKIEGLVVKGSADFNLLHELQELKLVMKE
ncbi:uncharacterized protein FSUBG_8 [Fusarium subglutinans]|uniref:Uncharacterized protein n=1 Tax=Gibberella subglutinans TaxID=42677 RepID=A0A8H5QGD9_GIBSU|nr:uncharacterized protein FSUBG_8 [Fusarium subglutinans]KAF5614128.1 hypothetical protein FSUBG_8 [Fusarium subglutinans]